ncbi:PQQ-binding-like beta-propeller repeat protein [bacterium]|nr:PQQ-binding-like beta-propeller repeat protein [bacterium]
MDYMNRREWSSLLVKTAAIAGIVLTETFTNAFAQVELGPPTSTHFWPGSLRAVDWLPTGDGIIVISAHGVHFRNLATKQITKTFPLGDAWVNDAAITDDGKILFTLTTAGDLRQWDVATATVTHEVDVQPGYESRIAVARDSDLLAVPSITSGQIDLRKKSDLTLIRTLATGHGDAGAVELSADGSTLAAILGLQSVAVYEVSTGSILWQGNVWSSNRQAGFLAPDGSALFLGDQKIDLPTGTRSTIPHGTGGQIAGLSRDGHIASLLLPQTTNAPASISDVNLDSGDLLWDSEIELGYIPYLDIGRGLVKFSSDGKSLLTGDYQQLIVLDAATGMVASRELTASTYGILSSDSSKLICAYQDGSIRTWNVASETQDYYFASPLSGRVFQSIVLPHPTANEFLVSDFVFDPVLSESTEIRRYSLVTGSLLGTYPYHNAFFTFTDHGTNIYVRTLDGSFAGIVDLATGNEGPLFGGATGHGIVVQFAGTGPSGDRMALCYPHQLDIYNAGDGSLVSSIPIETGGVYGLPVFSPDESEVFILESTVFGMYGQQIDVDSSRTIRTYTGRMSRPLTSAWSSDNRFLAFSRNISFNQPLTVIVDPRTGTTLAQISDFTAAPSMLRFTPDNRALQMVTLSGEVRQYDLGNLISLRGDTSNDGKLTLKWDDTEPNATYSLEESSNVAPAGWQSTTTNQSGQTEITIDPNVPARFFRLKRTE